MANKREIIAALIEKGGATKESLMEGAEVNSAGLSSQFTYLRLTGKYPVKGDDGVFKFVSEETWNDMKANTVARGLAPKKSAAERKEALDKRVAKLQEQCGKKKDAFEKDATALNKLRLQKAEAEVGIALIELDAVNEELANASEEAEEVEETEETEA